MSQPQQPKVVAPQSAAANAAIATVCHLIAGGATVKAWSLLQMETTTKSQNRQLALLCVIALIAFAGGVTLLHVLITNYKCWVMHAYSIAALHEAQLTKADTDKNEESAKGPAQKKEAPKPEPPKTPTQPPPQNKPASTEKPSTKRRRRWRF